MHLCISLYPIRSGFVQWVRPGFCHHLQLPEKFTDIKVYSNFFPIFGCNVQYIVRFFIVKNQRLAVILWIGVICTYPLIFGRISGLLGSFVYDDRLVERRAIPYRTITGHCYYGIGYRNAVMNGIGNEMGKYHRQKECAGFHYNSGLLK